MKRIQLLAILLGMYFFVVAASADEDEARPQIDTIDILEAVRIAEGLLLNNHYYADRYVNREIEIKKAIRYTTPSLGSRIGGTVQVLDLDTGESVSEYYESEYKKRLRNKLVGRVYWLVDFRYIADVLGPDLTCYIDAETSELIGTSEWLD